MYIYPFMYMYVFTHARFSYIYVCVFVCMHACMYERFYILQTWCLKSSEQLRKWIACCGRAAWLCCQAYGEDAGPCGVLAAEFVEGAHEP